MNILDGEPLTDANREDFEDPLENSYQILNPNLNLPGLDQLINSGDISLVDDDQLHSALLGFAYAQRSRGLVFTHIREILNTNARDFFRAVTYEIHNTGSGQKMGIRFHPRYDIDHLRNNALLRSAMGNFALMHSYMPSNLVGVRDILDELIAAMDNRG